MSIHPENPAGMLTPPPDELMALVYQTRVQVDDALIAADSISDMVVYLHPDDFPEVTTILGVPVKRHSYVYEGTALVVNQKRLDAMGRTTP